MRRKHTTTRLPTRRELGDWLAEDEKPAPKPWHGQGRGRPASTPQKPQAICETCGNAPCRCYEGAKKIR